MDQTAILLTSMTIGIVGWGLIAKIWVIPWIKTNPLDKGLLLLIIPHVFRYIGLSFLIAGITNSPLDPRFAIPAAYGDLTAALLALVAITALLVKLKYTVSIVWIFNIVGFIDFLVAVTQGLRFTHPDEMGATYFIPVLVVPLLFVSHLLIFWMLLKINRIET